MAKTLPNKKLSKKVLTVLKDNDFEFRRYTSHAIFVHTPSGKMVTVAVSKRGGKGFLSGDQYTIKNIRNFLEGEGYDFVESK